MVKLRLPMYEPSLRPRSSFACLQLLCVQIRPPRRIQSCHPRIDLATWCSRSSDDSRCLKPQLSLRAFHSWASTFQLLFQWPTLTPKTLVYRQHLRWPCSFTIDFDPALFSARRPVAPSTCQTLIDSTCPPSLCSLPEPCAESSLVAAISLAWGSVVCPTVCPH